MIAPVDRKGHRLWQALPFADNERPKANDRNRSAVCKRGCHGQVSLDCSDGEPPAGVWAVSGPAFLAQLGINTSHTIAAMQSGGRPLVGRIQTVCVVVTPLYDEAGSRHGESVCSDNNGDLPGPIGLRCADCRSHRSRKFTAPTQSPRSWSAVPCAVESEVPKKFGPQDSTIPPGHASSCGRILELPR